jgi:hypothetical protein
LFWLLDLGAGRSLASCPAAPPVHDAALRGGACGFQLANDVLECFDDLVEFDLFFRRLNRLGFAA